MRRKRAGESVTKWCQEIARDAYADNTSAGLVFILEPLLLALPEVGKPAAEEILRKISHIPPSSATYELEKFLKPWACQPQAIAIVNLTNRFLAWRRM